MSDDRAVLRRRRDADRIHLWPVVMLAIAAFSLGLSGAAADTQPRPTAAAARTLDLGCPSPWRPGGQSLRLKVTKWCGLDGPNGQWQLKLQLRITNTGDRPMGVALSHFRLAMSHFDPARWHPASTTPGERPFVATYQGRRVWLVPASPDGAAVPDPPPPGNYTFATHWGVSTPLAAHSTFNPSYRHGDAVFFVPREKNSHGKLDGVVGVAYVNGQDVLVICPPERWGPKVRAGSF